MPLAGATILKRALLLPEPCGGTNEVNTQSATPTDNKSTYCEGINSNQSKHSRPVENVHRTSLDDRSDDDDDNEDRLPGDCDRPLTREEMHEPSDAVMGAWPRNSSYSTSSQFSTSNASDTDHLHSFVLASAKEPLIVNSTPNPGPFSSPRRPISALPRTPHSRHHHRRKPLLSPPSTPPGPTFNPGNVFPYPPVQLELPQVEHMTPVVPLCGGNSAWSEKRPSWGTMIGIVAGQHLNTGAAVTEAQIGAVQAVIQANYDSFLASKSMGSRFPGACKPEGANQHRTDVGDDEDDGSTISSAQSEREAFERIFMGERSVSDGSGQDSAGTQAKPSSEHNSTKSTRTSSDGTAAAAADTCADESKGPSSKMDGPDQWLAR
jgi:hypothetical protein